jgi:hypothetical protein
VQQGVGPRDEILGKLLGRRSLSPAAANLKVVSDTGGGGQS